jgi:hypothetical protein
MNPVQLDTTQATTETIDYVVNDQNGLTSTSTRTVIIQAANDTKPQPQQPTTTLPRSPQPPPPQHQPPHNPAEIRADEKRWKSFPAGLTLVPFSFLYRESGPLPFGSRHFRFSKLPTR